VSEHPFYRLAPFIREYIYRHQWTELRDTQVKAAEVVFNSDAHLILAAGTASGKTEAAFLPVLTCLEEEPSSSLGILYIGPTKALINDQFYRLEGLLEEAHIPVWAWHGDISADRKRKLLREPRGVLQITPESLESLLINRATALTRLFHDLRFVIIDEIHVFMHADRGRQVLCQLQRLEPFMQAPPRRIGLSATLGDYGVAEAWLKAKTERPVVTVTSSAQETVRLAVEHFYRKQAGDKGEEEPDPYDQYIFDRAHERKKTLIFANSRGETETIISALRHMAQRQELPDIYHVHHGSISAPLRESAERAMNRPDQPTVTAATVTLELGIDIGQLERIIQLGAPFSVSSFLQRLGRSGRRGNPSEMWLVCSEDEPSGKESLPEQIPWRLLQAVAIIQLYVEERWIEPIRPIRHPFSLLYHQTMSTLASMGELSPAALAQRVLTLAPFQSITQEDYRALLHHLLEVDHLEQLESGGLIIGLAGEKVVNNYRFYAVFQDEDEFAVLSKEGEIGRITAPPPPGYRFALAGRSWEVLEVNYNQRTVLVKRVGGRTRNEWIGSGGEVHPRVLQRMRQALLEDAEYRYLQPGAQQRLREARHLARQFHLADRRFVPLSGDEFAVFPWLGTIDFLTLLRILNRLRRQGLELTAKDGHVPYYLKVVCADGADTLLRELVTLHERGVDAIALLNQGEAPEVGKFDKFVPDDLRRKAFAADFIDVQALKRFLGR
jgi:ATP-dependent Lhr-like helicase